MLSRQCPVELAWSGYICRLRPDSIQMLSNAKMFQNSTVINMIFGNNTYVRLRTIIEYNTIVSSKSRLQCVTQCYSRLWLVCVPTAPMHPEYWILFLIFSINVRLMSCHYLIDVGSYSVYMDDVGTDLDFFIYKLDQK